MIIKAAPAPSRHVKALAYFVVSLSTGTSLALRSMPSLRENLKKSAIAVAWAAVPTIGALAGATAQELKDTICVQGTYSIPCAKIIWCPAAKCGIGIALPDGDLDVVYSSEPSISGTRRRLWQAGSAMSLQHLTGRVIVFELDDSPPNSGSDLAVKGILYVIMTPPNAD